MMENLECAKAHVRSSESSLWQLSNKANSHLRVLTTLATSQEILDDVLTHLIASKLDHQTQGRWEEGFPAKELPKCVEFSTWMDDGKLGMCKVPRLS
ncbi:uncharacterized protein [Drosophila suzukii]|uniref:Uncharacterized protein isoform X2 n=1 Tax=Drosophila suzukii TaxID=28584 RepID=A0ABM4TWJ6_DROSZ